MIVFLVYRDMHLHTRYDGKLQETVKVRSTEAMVISGLRVYYPEFSHSNG